ncbi:MAG: hypothetical protein ACFCVD_19320 [Nodosilinea sp.]
MPKTFLYTNAPSDSENEITPAGLDRDKVRILVIGRPAAINRVVLEMSHLGFSDSVEWSKPLPTDRQNESMRILTRYVFADS